MNMQHQEWLESAHLKITQPRLKLLEVLRAQKRPITLHELEKKLGKTGIDPVTIYRNLATFESVGLVEKIELKQSQAYFELKDANHDHHHLICLNCKKIEEIDICVFDTLRPQILEQAPDFAEITTHSFEFFGTCRSCMVH